MDMFPFAAHNSRPSPTALDEFPQFPNDKEKLLSKHFRLYSILILLIFPSSIFTARWAFHSVNKLDFQPQPLGGSRAKRELFIHPSEKLNYEIVIAVGWMMQQVLPSSCHVKSFAAMLRNGVINLWLYWILARFTLRQALAEGDSKKRMKKKIKMWINHCVDT